MSIPCKGNGQELNQNARTDLYVFSLIYSGRTIAGYAVGTLPADYCPLAVLRHDLLRTKTVEKISIFGAASRNHGC